MNAVIFTLTICCLHSINNVSGDLIGDLLDELTGSAKSSYYDPYNEPVGYGNQATVQYSYSPPTSYQHNSPPSYQYNPQPSYDTKSYQYSPQPSYDTNSVETGYGKQQSGYGSQQGYAQPMEMSYSQPAPHSYSPPTMSKGYGHQQKPKKERVYVPVVVRKKKKKKMKIITVQKGFYIAGGTQLFGKYKSLKSCQKACAATPTCFSGDYNPWLKKCYIHSNFTACGTLKAHKKLVHFKKVPCDFPEAPMGRIMLGVQVGGGIEQPGIKSLSDCVKKCASTGVGIPATADTMQLVQKCFGVDYDFGTHKCFFHTNNFLPIGQFCPLDGTEPLVPRDATAHPAVVSILLCPGLHTDPAE